MKRIPPTLACIAAVLLAVACEDSQARRRAEVQQIIMDQGVALDRAAAQLSGPEHRGELQQTLKLVIRALGGTGDGTEGQRAAAAQIASAAHRRLAWISQQQAGEIESARRAQRSAIDGMINVAGRLDSMASGLEAFDTSDLRSDLAQTRRETEQALSVYSEQMAELDGPIAEGNRENSENRQEVETIRTQAGDLRREATDLGPFEGHPMQQRALDLDRQADRIEYDIANRELELHYTTEAEHRQAENNVELIRERIDTIDGAQKTLDAMSAEAQGQAEATRAMLAEVHDAIMSALAELDQSSSELAGLYEQAVTELNNAADKAKSAVNWVRGEADTADILKLEAAQVLLQLGRVQAARARGLGGQAALLERLGDSGAGDPAALRRAQQEASGQAQAAFAGAKQMLDQVSGRTARAQLEQLKASLAKLESAAGGEPIVQERPKPSTPAPAPATPAPGPAQQAGVYGSGADSPQEIVAALQRSDVDSMHKISQDYTYVKLATPDEERFYRASLDSNRAMLELEQALKEKFGTGLRDMAGQMMPGLDAGTLGEGGDAKLGEVSGDSGTIEVTANGQTIDMSLVRIDGRWFIDGTNQVRQMMEGMKSMGGMPSAEFIAGMAAAAGDLVKRVRAGEFGSVQEAMMALGQAMQQIPGAPGSPRAPGSPGS